MGSSLSLAVMVKNDHERLRRCLISLREFVDEIVVLDTGSQDATLEVAREFGARIEEIEWPNNFALALNVLLGLVQTDWTLRLDSDEWFEPHQAKRLKPHVQEDRVCAYTLIRKDKTNSGIVDETDILRLWRTHERIRYAGIVHETISRSDIETAWPGRALLRSDISFWHDGYLGDALRQKGERNLDLLRLDAELRPDNLEVQAMYAMALFGTERPGGRGEMDRVMDQFLQSQAPPPGNPQVAQALVIYLEALPHERLREEKTTRLLEKAGRYFPKYPVVLFYLGLMERKRENLESALQYLLRLEALVRANDYERSMSVPAPFVGEKMWRALGFVATKLGREDIVLRCRQGLSAAEAAGQQPR